MNQLATIPAGSAPAIIAGAGARATYRFVEFFTAQIRNPNTRRSYARSVVDFLIWLEEHGVASIAAVSSLHVATYIEELGRTRSAPTVKLRLAATSSLFD